MRSDSRNRRPVPATPAWIAVFLLGLCFATAAAAEDMHKHIQKGAVDAPEGAAAFAADGPLDESHLNAVRGFGVDPGAGAAVPASTELSVILFDELGRPKPAKPGPRNTGNSTVSRGINVQVGR